MLSVLRKTRNRQQRNVAVFITEPDERDERNQDETVDNMDASSCYTSSEDSTESTYEEEMSQEGQACIGTVYDCLTWNKYSDPESDEDCSSVSSDDTAPKENYEMVLQEKQLSHFAGSKGRFKWWKPKRWRRNSEKPLLLSKNNGQLDNFRDERRMTTDDPCDPIMDQEYYVSDYHSNETTSGVTVDENVGNAADGHMNIHDEKLMTQSCIPFWNDPRECWDGQIQYKRSTSFEDTQITSTDLVGVTPVGMESNQRLLEELDAFQTVVPPSSTNHLRHPIRIQSRSTSRVTFAPDTKPWFTNAWRSNTSPTSNEMRKNMDPRILSVGSIICDDDDDDDDEDNENISTGSIDSEGNVSVDDDLSIESIRLELTLNSKQPGDLWEI